MKKEMKRVRKKRLLLLIGLLIIAVGIFVWAFLFIPSVQFTLEQGWRSLTKEAGRTLGLKRRDEVPLEEKRIREEVILKKMEEASAQQDWRSLAPEYPRPKKIEAATDEERMKAIRNTPEFKELERELKEYLGKKEDQLLPEPPVPSIKEASKIEKMRDRAAEKIAERMLLVAKEKPLPEKVLDENLQLGIKGPLVSRKILERPSPPQVKVKVEAEIEMTIWVLPNGMVDRVIPALKGETELERIAGQYLKQWRFAPLPRDQAQSEQWGTIPIKFKLQ
ncbi:MAG: energy transducer TonB [Deltaproteobacteria bacterium]|nr:energy transducer TonB [Deltaproteobacteria bacterium]